MNFKIGDRVRVKKSTFSIHKNQTGVITSTKFGISVLFHQPSDICKEHSFGEDEIEYLDKEIK